MLNSAIKLAVWILRIAVFVALFGLAIKNSAPMELHFFFNQTWMAPIAVVILLVFFAGAVVGLTAALSMLVRTKSPKQLHNLQSDGN